MEAGSLKTAPTDKHTIVQCNIKQLSNCTRRGYRQAYKYLLKHTSSEDTCAHYVCTHACVGRYVLTGACAHKMHKTGTHTHTHTHTRTHACMHACTHTHTHTHTHSVTQVDIVYVDASVYMYGCICTFTRYTITLQGIASSATALKRARCVDAGLAAVVFACQTFINICKQDDIGIRTHKNVAIQLI